jgi:hypothetical protein
MHQQPQFGPPSRYVPLQQMMMPEDMIGAIKIIDGLFIGD